MPTYQYACTVCGHTFEKVQSFSDDALTHCPECDGRLRKVFNAVGVVFKGSGFYRTDSRSDGTAGRSAAAKEKSGSSSSGSSDAKSGSGTSGSGSSSSGSSNSGTSSSGSSNSGTSGSSSSSGAA